MIRFSVFFFTVSVFFFCAMGVVSADGQVVPMANYVITIDAKGQVTSRDGISGKVILQGMDASTIIQTAINSLPETGGKIFINAGCYQLTSTLTIEDKHGVHIEGVARGIKFSGGRSGTTLRSDKAIDLVRVFGNTKKLAGITLSNMNLIGTGKDNGKVGILVDGATDLLSIHQVGVNLCGTGIYLRGEAGGIRTGVIDACQIQFCDPQVCGTGLRIERCHYGKVVGGEFSDCSEYGIVLSSPKAGGSRNQGIKISNMTAVRNIKGGILVGASADDTTISGGCDFSGSPTGCGVHVSDEGTGHVPRNVIISGNHIYNNKKSGIYLEKAAHVVVTGNICSGHDHVVVTNHGQPFGIRVGKEASDVIVTGNLCYDNGEKGILVESETTTTAANRTGK